MVLLLKKKILNPIFKKMVLIKKKNLIKDYTYQNYKPFNLNKFSKRDTSGL